MKIAITGHTRGIGKAVADLYHADQICGFSLSNGFDVSAEPSRQQIVLDSEHCDVFINNAYHETGQLKMFEQIYQCWKLVPGKTIVNINSKVKYSGFVKGSYVVSKKQLYSAALQAIRDTDRKCRVININPGFVETDLISRTNKKVLAGRMMSVTDLAGLIGWCINQPAHIEIAELSVWLTGS
jgi:NAD(P)-dependent dehydrogenase (short-subunit alcohol dehydrogenase family)